MRSRLPLILASLALVVALVGTRSAAPGRRRYGARLFTSNAGAVKGIKASKTPKPGQLVPLGRNGRFPTSVVPIGVQGPPGPQGARGSAGAKGTQGPQGIPGAAASIADGSITPGKLATAPAGRVVKSDLQAPPAMERTPVTWSGERYDTANLFDPAQPTRVTAPIAGLYLVEAGAIRDFTASATVIVKLAIRKNGSVSFASVDQTHANAGVRPIQSVTAVVNPGRRRIRRGGLRRAGAPGLRQRYAHPPHDDLDRQRPVADGPPRPARRPINRLSRGPPTGGASDEGSHGDARALGRRDAQGGRELPGVR